MNISKENLENLYMNNKQSPEQIAKIFNVTGRTIRNWMRIYGIERLGSAHLRKDISAHWNIGRERSNEWREKQSIAHFGKTPCNFGIGRIKFNCEVCDK